MLVLKLTCVFWAKYVETLPHRRSLGGYGASISYTTPASHVSNPTNLEIPGFFTIGSPDRPGYILLDMFIDNDSHYLWLINIFICVSQEVVLLACL